MRRMNAEKALLLLRSRTATCGQTTHVRFLPSLSAIRPFLCRSFVFPLALPLSRGTRERTMLLKRARILPLKKGDEARDEKKTEGGRGKQVPPQTFHI